MTSQLIIGATQADGRTYITELHTDAIGMVHRVEYLSNAGDDRQAIMVARALQLGEELKVSEVNEATDGGNVLTPVHQTGASFISRWRTRFKGAQGEQLVRMGKWLIQAVTDERITVTQIKNAFSLNDTQWATLRDKLIVLRDKLDDITKAKGE